MKQYPIYDITFDPSNDIGLTAISFVDAPAIEQNFVWFGKDNESEIKSGQILLFSSEKHEIVSPILIPNQLILRINEQGEYYYVRWSKETIEQVAQYYILNQFNNNFTLNHEWFETGEGEYEDSFIKDVYLKRMWIIDDPKNDIANKKYGYRLPEGTLMVNLKIHNRKLWQKIKSGEVKGLSIEAFVPSVYTETINYKKSDNKMKNPKELFEQFMLWYNEVSEEAKELADVAATDETESGEVALRYYTSDSDYIEIAADGSARASDGSVPQDGEYKLSDGNILVIADGKFSETKEAEQTDEPEPVEAPIAEEQADDEEKKDDEEKTDEPSDEEKKEEQEEMPPYTLVEIEIAGEVYQVPQQVADYIKMLEENAGMAENFRKELAKIQSRTPSVKPVGNVVKEEKGDKKDKIADCYSLISNLNKKLK